MKRLISQIIAAILGLWLATLFVPSVIIRAYPTSNFFGFSLTEQWEIFLVLGIVLGLLNYFLRPLLKTLLLPFEIVTLGLFTIVINMFLIWLLDVMFSEFYAPLFFPLLFTSLIVWVLSFVGLYLTKKY